ncbi:ComEC/Rec2 family competence protein [Aequorivita ciconiae]|uniref:ComEC/Rec2 family competence protein n=1 Tax=Aequorivita ciconiae TaxID=2494375 RepID=UPI0013E2B2A3|nr:ComEC/Rec2 family competence protein [Aequorivita sp. H23M31]
MISRKQLIQQIYFGSATYLCFFAVGYFSYQLRLPQFRPNHFTYFVAEDAPKIIQIKIFQTLKPDNYNYKYFANVQAINEIPVSGNIVLVMAKDSLHPEFKPDEVLLVYGSISTIPQPLNPHQFDYSKYMKSQGVYGQIRVSEKQVLKAMSSRSTIFGTAQNLRTGIVEKLKESKLKTDERAIVQALILGEKKDIDKSLYDEYAAAGAVHILAVSGLHVGILYAILAVLFAPLKRWKYGNILGSVSIILLLWFFAILSGLSPSVTRAVTMFSFFAFAQILQRRTNGINTLFLSLLTILIINPLWLFQVGFQLSYLAVFFILWLHPILYKIGYSTNWFLRKLWGIASVTICAQIGVLPLNLYYFHQFPGLFLLTNIVVLPFLTILMCGGLLIVILAVINTLPDWLAETYNAMIEALNGFIYWIADKDEFLFKDIHFSTLKVLGTYLMVIALGMLLRKLNYSRLVYSLLSMTILVGVFIYDEFRTSKNQLILFHKNNKTILAYKRRGEMLIFHNDSTADAGNAYPIKSYKTAMNIRNISETSLPTVVSYKNRNILILDSLALFPKQGNIHTVILTENSKVNLTRLIDSVKPFRVLADGTNYYSYKNRWKATCKLKKLPFFDTAEQGAFLIE